MFITPCIICAYSDVVLNRCHSLWTQEFTKHASLKDYMKSKIKMHWCPDSGDPSGKKKKKLNIKAAGGGADPSAIRMMAEAAANKQSQMMNQELAKMEAIKRRQKREIDRVIANEGKMANLQARILKAELAEAENKKAHQKTVMLNKKNAIKAKQNQDLNEKRKLDEEILNRNRMAAKEMDVERKLAEREKKEEIIRRKEAREKEIYRAQLMKERQQKTQKIFDDLEEQAQRTRERIEERNQKISMAFEERKRIKAIEIRENRAKAEERIERAKTLERERQIKKKVDFDKRVADHIIMKAEQVEARRAQVEAAAKKLSDKHKRQKGAYQNAMQKIDDFRAATIKHAEDRDGYYEEVQKIVRNKQAILATHNGLRQKEVLDNVRRINNIHDAIRNQRFIAAEADDERTDAIRAAKAALVQERMTIAHDANMRKWRVNECMEKMRISNKFTNLEQELDRAMNPGKKITKNQEQEV